MNKIFSSQSLGVWVCHTNFSATSQIIVYDFFHAYFIRYRVRHCMYIKFNQQVLFVLDMDGDIIPRYRFLK